MNKIILITTIKEVEGSKEPALIVESEDICSRTVEDLATTTIIIIIKTTVTAIEIIIIGDGVVITVVNRIETIKITEIITLFNNHNNDNNSNSPITIRLTIFR